MATKKVITTQDKIDTITSATKFTATELLNLPVTKFEEIYLDVVEMKKAIASVEIHELLLHAGKSDT